MTDRDILRTHSLRKYDQLVWREHLRELGGWILAIAGMALAVWLLVIVSGCGGGPQAAVQPPAPIVTPAPVPPSTPPPPTPAPTPTPPAPPPPVPVILPALYHLQILLPLVGGSSAQAEAISDSGTIVGWSVINGDAQATEWAGGQALWLGAGFALAINSPPEVDGVPQAGQVAGYMLGEDGRPVAMEWPANGRDQGVSIGKLAGYDSSEALGIDDDGTVVGVAFQLAQPNQQAAWRWDPVNGMTALSGMQVALAIHNGRVVGIGGNLDASVGGTQDLGIQGAAAAISDAGAAGYTSGSTQGFDWDGSNLILLGTNGTALSLASGINAGGIIVGQQGNGPVGSVRLARRGSSARAMALAARDAFVGSTRAMAWTSSDGMVDLNGRLNPDDAGNWALVFATGVNSLGMVAGAAVNQVTMETRGFLLEPR